jgi:prepilin peptidase CpaA
MLRRIGGEMIHALLSAALLVFPALVITGAILDLVSFRIPNWISLALVAGFAGGAAAGMSAGLPMNAVALDVAVGAAAFVLGAVMFALRWIGGGDAKLFAAVALWLGWPALPTFVAATALSGGGLALLLLSLRSATLRPLVATGPAWFVRLAEPGESAPYGVAIAIGALTAFPASAFAGAVWGV